MKRHGLYHGLRHDTQYAFSEELRNFGILRKAHGERAVFHRHRHLLLVILAICSLRWSSQNPPNRGMRVSASVDPDGNVTMRRYVRAIAPVFAEEPPVKG